MEEEGRGDLGDLANDCGFFLLLAFGGGVGVLFEARITLTDEALDLRRKR